MTRTSILPVVREAVVTLLIAAVVLVAVLVGGAIVVTLPVILPVAFLVSRWRLQRRHAPVPREVIQSERPSVPEGIRGRRAHLTLIAGGKSDNARRSAPWTHNDRPRAG